MSDAGAHVTQPRPCHHNHNLNHRTIRDQHRDNCPTNHPTNPHPCPTTDCAPCTAPHCHTCRRKHTTNDHPRTCPECITTTRNDLTETQWLARHLRWHATRAGRDGRLLAAAPIPGGDALTLYARTGPGWDDLHTARGLTTTELTTDHHPDDVVPIVLPVAGWNHQWCTHLGHTHPTPTTFGGLLTHLADMLTTIAQTDPDTGPSWRLFTEDMGALRRQLEGVLHDETEPEHGIGCFDCGRRLVRKFSDPKPCRHRTPGRDRLDQVNTAIDRARHQLDAIRTYPELGPPTYADLRAARRTPTAAEESAARVPCQACATSRTGQGGIADPSVGQSWECIGCRRSYTPGEYAHAVRRDLLERGTDGDGWTHITMAAEAATTQTGLMIPAAVVRKWAARATVSSLCRWSRGVRWGQPLVFWPDVAEEAARAVQRMHDLEVARLERARDADRLRSRMAAKAEDPVAAGRALGIHPARVRAIVRAWEAEEAAEDGPASA